jgi:hypothetical protein
MPHSRPLYESIRLALRRSAGASCSPRSMSHGRNVPLRTTRTGFEPRGDNIGASAVRVQHQFHRSCRYEASIVGVGSGVVSGLALQLQALVRVVPRSGIIEPGVWTMAPIEGRKGPWQIGFSSRGEVLWTVRRSVREGSRDLHGKPLVGSESTEQLTPRSPVARLEQKASL